MLSKNLILICSLGLVLSGCGGGGSNNSNENLATTQIKEDKTLKLKAVNHLNRVAQENFNGFKVMLFTNKELNQEQKLSKDTKAIYGLIDNKPTNALLKVNANYNNATFIVKVYKNSKLVGQSKKFKLEANKEYANFGKITTIK
jgi:hypothetical protein